VRSSFEGKGGDEGGWCGFFVFSFFFWRRGRGRFRGGVDDGVDEGEGEGEGDGMGCNF